MIALTPNQKKAVASSGNVLVVAGAGAGKTGTLVQRCLAFLLDAQNPGSLDEILMVTFTEAAAAEMRRRIREQLEERLRVTPENFHLAEQLALLDSARVGTLHSFCLRLARENFYALGLDSQINVLSEEQARLLAREVLDDLLMEIYEGKISIAESAQRLIAQYGQGGDKPVRDLIARLHEYTQTLPDPAGWFAEQLRGFAQSTPTQWEKWFHEELARWKNWWLPVLHAQDAANVVAQKCAAIVARLTQKTRRAEAAEVFQEILATDADGQWPKNKKTIFREPIENIFAEAEFLKSLSVFEKDIDPLEDDWNWVRPHITALLQLAQEFGQRFSRAKRDAAALDFHDLEQCALEILWNRNARHPTATAESWRKKLRLILVDEYQDINQAQDTILQSLAGEGAAANRFLVGDVKQSIYRFRLADPRIFLDYETAWKTAPFSQVISLSDNFRSHEAILNFVNPLFAALMKKEIGGVEYDDEAKLVFGNRAGRFAFTVAADANPRVELHLRSTEKSEVEESNGDSDSLSNTEKEARMIALRLLELKTRAAPENGQQEPASWSDMVILLRSPRRKAESFAKEFARLGIPLTTSRTGFYESLEVMDVLHLLRLLDNPWQDVPLLAVLRSPFVGLSLDELAAVRISHRDGKFWLALQRWRTLNPANGTDPKLSAKLEKFLERFERWRKLKLQKPLSQLVETILDETHYPDWLLAQSRGEQRRANVERLLGLTRQFDALHGQGLYRFLRFIEAQADAEIDLEPAPVGGGDAVRLMSIHQSKGLEFPIVVVADLGKQFNFSDTKERVILDEVFGVAPQVTPPGARQSYPSLPHWLAQRRQRTETLGEEMRLLYVAMTRAIDRLILCGTASAKAMQEKWPERAARGLDVQEISDAKNYLAWIGPWLVQQNVSFAQSGGNELLRWTIHRDSDAHVVAAKNFSAEKSLASPEAVSPEKWRELGARLSWHYEFSAATMQPAKTSVSALRRELEEEMDDEAQPLFSPRRKLSSAKKIPGKLSAAEIGSAHHRFLELVSLEKVGSEAELQSEAARLQREGIFSAEEMVALDFNAVAAFWNSAIGRRFLENSGALRREHPFTTRLNAEDFARLKLSQPANNLTGEFIVLQGVIDLVVILPAEIWLLDFKTDQIKPAELRERAEFYRPQVVLYADALRKIYRRPVTQCWLHFLSSQTSVEMER